MHRAERDIRAMTDRDRHPMGPGEAARRLGVSTRTVQRWLREGRLPAVTVGARLKVDPAAFEQPAAFDSTEGAVPATPVTSSRPIRRLLIANRGEPVVRIARTAHELGMTVVGLEAPAEPGFASWRIVLDETLDVPSYLDRQAIVDAAVECNNDAVHPGWGFLAEDAAFAEAVETAGMVWVGPPPAAMRALGDKAAARHLAEGLGIPILPGYDGDDQADATLAVEADRIGYPVLLKPSAGGGGKGMHVIRSAVEFPETLARARREALGSFGDERMVLERYMEAPRHVEVQLLFDAHGNGVHLGERECSLQRRHQKIIEESPSPNVSPALRRRLGGWALALGREAGYRSAGTAEFLITQDGEPYFLELNARLQVEHPVTEAVTGRDVVADQLRVAQGEALGFSQDDVRFTGHAIEARLYAEDPWAGFVPSAGPIEGVRWPRGEGIRVDAGVAVGHDLGNDPYLSEEVTTRFDPMLAKVIAHGSDRTQAVARLAGAIDELRVYGITTNRGFLRWLLRHPPVAGGSATTATIDADWHGKAPVPDDETWAAAAYHATASLRQPQARAGFRLNAPPVARIRLGEKDRTLPIASTTEPQRDEWMVGLSSIGEPRALAVGEPDPMMVALADLDGLALRPTIALPPTVDAAVSHAVRAAEGGQTVTAPMPGTILNVRVVDGEEVEAHQVLLLLEAMKMENAVSAPADATVRRVLVEPGQTVSRGEALVELA